MHFCSQITTVQRGLTFATTDHACTESAKDYVHKVTVLKAVWCQATSKSGNSGLLQLSGLPLAIWILMIHRGTPSHIAQSPKDNSGRCYTIPSTFPSPPSPPFPPYSFSHSKSFLHINACKEIFRIGRKVGHLHTSKFCEPRDFRSKWQSR